MHTHVWSICVHVYVWVQAHVLTSEDNLGVCSFLLPCLRQGLFLFITFHFSDTCHHIWLYTDSGDSNSGQVLLLTWQVLYPLSYLFSLFLTSFGTGYYVGQAGLELALLLRTTSRSLSSCHHCETLLVLCNAFTYMNMKEWYNSSVTSPHFTLCHVTFMLATLIWSLFPNEN